MRTHKKTIQRRRRAGKAAAAERAPRRAPRGDEPRARVSVTMTPADAAWAKRRADRLGTTVSSVVAAAVALARSGDGIDRVLALTGGSVELTDDEREQLSAELGW